MRSGLIKPDYSVISRTYDLARSIKEPNLGMWLDFIDGIIGHRKKIKLIDLGCGTGRFAIPIAIRLGYDVTAVDISEPMLLRAMEKEGASSIVWERQDAQNLEFMDETFDVVFMSHLAHLVDYPFGIFEESIRILKPDGLLLNRYGALEDVLDDPIHAFFPKTRELDECRTPTKMQIEGWYRSAGFRDTQSLTIVQRTYSSSSERLEKTKRKAQSILSLIHLLYFTEGIDRLTDYIRLKPDDPWLLHDKLTLTVGRK